MTMHLERVYFNNHGKCKKKLNAKQQRAKQEHEAWLRQRGLLPEQIEAKRKAAGSVRRLHDNGLSTQSRNRVLPPTSDKVGNGFKKEENRYTGGNLLGIATAHKSCLVPVFSKNQAEDLARMRR